MKAELIIVTKTYLTCPACKGNSGATIDHLAEYKMKSFGSWYCDLCGKSFKGDVQPDGSIELTATPSTKINTLDLVMIPANLPHPFYMLLKGMRFKYDGPDDRNPHDRSYFYDEGSCPTNWIPTIQQAIYDGDNDPHGLIQFVRGVDHPGMDRYAEGFTEAAAKLFPELLQQSDQQ